MKKMLTLLMAALLCLPCAFSLAEEAGETERETYTCGDFEYALLDDGTAKILWCWGEAETLDVPGKLDGYAVTAIGDYSFCYCSSPSIILPDSITSIGANPFIERDSLTKIVVSIDHPALATIDGVLFSKSDKRLVCYPYAFTQFEYSIPQGIEIVGNRAFYECSNLASITLPDSLTTIGNEAFAFCSGLTSITLPDSLSAIGNEAFAFCSGLTSISLPDSLSAIGNEAFASCSGLTSISLPDSVTSIGDQSFSYCSGLTSITLPDNLTFIGSNPFCRCNNLTEIIVSPDHQSLATIDGVLFSKSDKRLVCYLDAFAQPEYTMPHGIEIIGSEAFNGCSSLTSITLSDSLTAIGDGAFDSCIGLTSITLPDSVTTIGDRAFSTCRSLTSITLPDSLTSIGDQAFFGCSSLTSITLPDSVTSIGDQAFSFCSSLTSITLPDSLTAIGHEAFAWCENVTFTVGRDSYAKQYCIDNNLPYTYPDANDWLNN